MYMFRLSISCIRRFAFSSFFFTHVSTFRDKVHYSRTVHELFIGPTTTLFKKQILKNRSHSTIHTFKIYFATVFSIFSQINCIQTSPTVITKSIQIQSHPILPSQKITLSIIQYYFTILPTSQLLFYNLTH